jgi:hypothetical protein
VRRFLSQMILPSLILIAGLALDRFLPDDPRGALVPTPSAWALDDLKLARTARSIEGLAEGHQHPSRREPVGRPGMLFSFVMPDHVKRQYWEGRGEDNPSKLQWANVELAIEGGPPFQVLARVRGSSSGEVARKSLSLRLFSSQHFRDDIRLRRFLLINLYSDRTGFENRWCFNLLADLGLYPGYHELAKVEFNGESQGTYMLLERAEDAIRRTHPDTVSVLRRRTEHFELQYQEPGTDAWQPVRSLAACHTTDGFVEQLRCYERTLDLDLYLQWLAFNSLVENGDSVDELFYYERREDPQVPGRLRIMAWDFDDIQEAPAHPESVHPDPLMWAAEGELEQQIISNPVLYARYAEALRRLLEERLTEQRLTGALGSVQQTLVRMEPDLSSDPAGGIQPRDASQMEAFRQRLFRRRTELLQRASAVAAPDAAPYDG